MCVTAAANVRCVSLEMFVYHCKCWVGNVVCSASVCFCLSFCQHGSLSTSLGPLLQDGQVPWPSGEFSLLWSASDWLSFQSTHFLPAQFPSAQPNRPNFNPILLSLVSFTHYLLSEVCGISNRKQNSPRSEMEHTFLNTLKIVCWEVQMNENFTRAHWVTA